MRKFHLALANAIATITAVESNHYIELPVVAIPGSILAQISTHLGIKDFTKPAWTKIPFEVQSNSDFYLWFLYERSDQLSKAAEKADTPPHYQYQHEWDEAFSEYYDQIYG